MRRIALKVQNSEIKYSEARMLNFIYFKLMLPLFID